MQNDSIKPDDLRRIVVIGSSCCGKTTFAKRLSDRLDSKHIEMDVLNWLPDWEQRSSDELRVLAEIEVSSDEWVLDGNYSRAKDITWPRATSIIWLDFSFSRVFCRAIRRTLTRAFTGEVLFAGNRESIRNTFFSTDSMILWVIRTFRRRRRECIEWKTGNDDSKRRFIVLKTPKQAEEFLSRI